MSESRQLDERARIALEAMADEAEKLRKGTLTGSGGTFRADHQGVLRQELRLCKIRL